MKCYCCCITNDLQQVDPFLRLVDDSKLQALDHKIVVGDTVKIYGSKEDNEDALKSLSAINISDEQSSECFASMILKDLGKLSNVMSLSGWILQYPCLLVIWYSL